MKPLPVQKQQPKETLAFRVAPDIIARVNALRQQTKGLTKSAACEYLLIVGLEQMERAK